MAEADTSKGKSKRTGPVTHWDPRRDLSDQLTPGYAPIMGDGQLGSETLAKAPERRNPEGSAALPDPAVEEPADAD